MSIQVLTRNYEHNETRRSATPDHATSHAITSAMLRATGIVLLMSLAAIHVVQLVPTFQQSPLLGVAYVFLIGAAVVVGAPAGQRSPVCCSALASSRRPRGDGVRRLLVHPDAEHAA